jgi:cytochrome P450
VHAFVDSYIAETL